MSNDISYDLVFTTPKKAQLLQVKSYLEDKKSRWDNRGEKTAADLLKETGLQNAAEVVCLGFEFGKIQQNGSLEQCSTGSRTGCTSWRPMVRVTGSRTPKHRSKADESDQEGGGRSCSSASAPL